MNAPNGPKKRERGRPPKPRAEMRDRFVMARYTDEQYDLIERAAAADDCHQIGPWVARAALKHARAVLGIGQAPGTRRQGER